MTVSQKVKRHHFPQSLRLPRRAPLKGRDVAAGRWYWGGQNPHLSPRQARDLRLDLDQNWAFFKDLILIELVFNIPPFVDNTRRNRLNNDYCTRQNKGRQRNKPSFFQKSLAILQFP